MKRLLLAATLAALFPLRAAPGAPPRLKEPSGLARAGDEYLVVDDDHPGQVFALAIPADLRRTPPAPRRLTIAPVRSFSVGGPLALDPESVVVDPLDGRVALLSERLAAVVVEEAGRPRVLFDLGGTLNEFGNRGLEGLALRAVAGQREWAVLWEGGYPEAKVLPPGLAKERSWEALRPLVVLYEEATRKVRKVTLKVERPAGPWEQAFRAPDLVFAPPGVKDWRLLAILSSEHALPEGVREPKYAHRWLQRFDAKGKRVGEPLDLDALCAEAGWKDLAQSANWEGLSWHVVGESVALVFDTWPRGVAPALIVVPLPAGWR